MGIDVGTGSARAALVDATGKLIASHSQDTKTWRDPADARIFEQSTADIFGAICRCVHAVMKESGINKEDVKGIGFDATCSLAVVNDQGEPICVSSGKDKCGQLGERNIVLWADHRAEEEANLINESGSLVLEYVGGAMSLEMEIPKILWLKKHMSKEAFDKCMFFDLPDYLTYLVTGSLARSSCSLVCKCSYIPPGATPAAQGWNTEFFKTVGLEDMVNNGYTQLGGALGQNTSLVLTAGMPVGQGLTASAASQLGLIEGIPVGSAVIDAYAGWIGTVAARHYQHGNSSGKLSTVPTMQESQTRLAAVAGTSTCHLIQTPSGKFVPGVWGPYKNALFPNWWVNEGGQSSTGQLIDFVITTHPAYAELQELAKKGSKPIHAILAERLEVLKKEAGLDSLTRLTKDIHFYPDLHGNRSPLADPQMRGSIMGLSLDSSISDLALKFNVTLEAIALQTRHILDEMRTHGHDIRSMYISGGQAKNLPLMQLFADVCEVPVVLPNNHTASVVLGSAMLGKFAAEVTDDMKSRGMVSGFTSQVEVDKECERLGERLWEIMADMTQPGQMVSPSSSAANLKLLEAKYKIFRESIEIQRRWRAMMDEAAC